jgi:hypothetical protein
LDRLSQVRSSDAPRKLSFKNTSEKEFQEYTFTKTIKELLSHNTEDKEITFQPVSFYGYNCHQASIINNENGNARPSSRLVYLVPPESALIESSYEGLVSTGGQPTHN